MQIILERTGDSCWYVKHIGAKETPERAAAYVNLIVCGVSNNAENAS